ncbi:nucleotidyltransferase [Mycoplasmopsis columbina]|uniref:nucleotidyltransferase n=1 Tax=Mycoplasmopsis columbina TaxID=114881 RepID=UPI0004A6AC26|nr:nucleotidyltransferase [Mycoplasmopsis columbina]VEU76910.1 Protein of uncharacterised function (DUF795) [Mycoplasmopsis columbina]
MAIGIVVEYNPFHNGHIRQLEWIKKNFPNDKIIVVMSNKFSQRGELIVASFKNRKKIAKKYGVNKVLKLSFKEGVQAAHIFAKNAINKLYKYKIDKLVFGSESNNVQEMIDLAIFLKNNKIQFDQKIKYYLKKEKMAYPKAYAQTLLDLKGKNFIQPNDILGFEYVKHIINNSLKIKIFTLQRNIGYHSLETSDKYASATFLREKIQKKEDISYYSPLKIKKVYKIDKYYKKFQKIMLKTNLDKIKKIPLVTEGIENLFLKHLHLKSYQDFVQACTSKRYTASRIKRIMAWIINKKWK